LKNFKLAHVVSDEIYGWSRVYVLDGNTQCSAEKK